VIRALNGTRRSDSCLVCIVHAHDGTTGRELATFSIGETG